MNKQLVSIGKTEDGGDLMVDVPRLVEGKLVTQSSSGGGKSMTIRTLLERTHGMLPHIILDKDGEFASLRERHNYVLAGKSGDIPAHPKTAEVLAKRTMAMGFSLIVDLYDLLHADKHLFVRLFLEAVFNADKKLWRERLLVIDEAHRFCPENGEGVSEAKEIIIECCDDGRKRGLGVVLATQRIAKLDKSALAECENKLIGRTNYDDDRRRAGKELGFSAKDELLAIRDLRRGQFFAQGAALSDNVVKATIHLARTTHPKAGHRIRLKTPAPTAAVKAMLAKLKDIPKEAETDLRDRKAMAGRIADLESQIRVLKAPKPAAAPIPLPKAPEAAPGPTRAQIRGFLEADRRTVADACAHRADLAMEDIVNSIVGLRSSAAAALHAEINKMGRAMDLSVGAIAARLRKDLKASAGALPKPDIKEAKPAPAAETPKPARVQGPAVAPAPDVSDGKPLGECERNIVAFLAAMPWQLFTKRQVARLCRPRKFYSANGGGFNNALSRLRSIGAISEDGAGRMKLHDAAGGLGIIPPGSRPQHTVESWLAKLGAAERAIYEALQSSGRHMQKEEIAERTQYRPEGGGFNNAISGLKSIGLVASGPDGLFVDRATAEMLREA